MRFRVHDEVFEHFPTVCIGLVAAWGVDNAESNPKIEALLREAEQEACTALNKDSTSAERSFGPWRAAFTSLGISAGRFKGSVEALASRALKGSRVPSLSPAVNLANAASLRFLLPLGSHDLDCLRGDMEVGPAPAGFLFTSLGQSEAEEVPQGEFVYRDEHEVRTRRWIWRQSDHSKVTPTSRNILFPIDGWVGDNDHAVLAARDLLVHCLEEELGARTAVFYLDRDHREVIIASGELGSEQVIYGDDGFRMAGKGYVERQALPAESAEEPVEIPTEAPARSAADRWSRWLGLDAIGTLLERGTEGVVVRADFEARLRRGDKLRVKFGVDPTSPNLHLGHAVVLRKLRAFQRLGHKICLVIGDFTAQIGDASDRTAMRQMLSEETVLQNLATYRKQIGRILDEDQVEWSYNADWLGPLRFKDIVGLAANFTVAQILERENFTNRYAAGQPIGLQEFLYPLMQGYDSVALKADVELGGTEQLFNLLAGRTLQRAFGQSPQAVMTLTLLLGLDGLKMSKSAGNAVSLEEPAVDMYGKLMSIPDEQILPYFELCTDLPLDEISAVAEELAGGANPMLFKKRLALEVTNLYHSAAQARKAQETFEHEVQGRGVPVQLIVMPISASANLSGSPSATQPPTTTQAPMKLLADLLVELKLAPSKSYARRKIVEGAVRIDETRLTGSKCYGAIDRGYGGAPWETRLPASDSDALIN